MKQKKYKPLSQFEWDLTWSSLRYFCGRYTIASACYPGDLVKNFGKRLTEEQKNMLSKEIVSQINYAKQNDDNLWLKVDMEPWSALGNYFDKSTWRSLFCQGPDIEDTVVIAFPCELKDSDNNIITRWIPIDSYEKSGSVRTSVYDPYIKQINEYDESK